MKPTQRRSFMATLIAASALAMAPPLRAQSGPAHVDENSDQSNALGYRHDTVKVDVKKYPKHAATQRCSNCSFFQGKPDDPWAGCAMFGRKQIANAGWCLAWAKAPG